MVKSIKVPFDLSTLGQSLSIPVQYSIEEKNNELSLIHCKVDLPIDEIPEWLHPYEFVIKKFHRAGVTTRSILADKYRTVEASLFTNVASDHIRVKETNEHRFN